MIFCITITTPPTQGELLATLGIFAEPMMHIKRFIRLVTKERLMESELISYLLKEKTAELVEEKAVLEEKTAAWQQVLHLRWKM